MRRVWSIAFFVLALGCAVILYLRLGPPKPTTRPAVEGAPPTPDPAPAPPPRLAVPEPPRDAGRDMVATASDEKALMRQLRALVKTDPPRAEALAREARQRFPQGAEADERDALLVDSLINQQRIGRARDETYYYFDHHPNGRFAEHLFIMTGIRPRPGRQ